jgi:hypothetical protein
MKTHTKTLLAALTATAGLAVGSADAASLLSDDFTLAGEVGEYSLQSPAANGGVLLTHNTTGPVGDGNNMNVDPGRGNLVGKLFDVGGTITLANTGDYLELSFDYKQATGAGGGIRLGFFNSEGDGFAASIGTPGGTNLGVTDFVKDDWGVGLDVYGGVSAGLDSDANQALLFRIELNSDGGFDLSATWSSANSGAITSNEVTVASGNISTFSFDRIGMGFGPNTVSTTTSAYDVDNVLATTNVPEPVSLSFGLVGLGTLCIRRRRRNA